MKTTINDITYDTDIDKALGSTDTPMFGETETLYRKPSGEFYLHGISGPHGRYAWRWSDDSSFWMKGEAIIPLDFDKAVRWANENLSNSNFEEYFGSELGLFNKQPIMFYLSSASIRRLNSLATHMETYDVSQVIEDLLYYKT